MSDRKVINTLECYVKDGDKYLMLTRDKSKKIFPGTLMAPGGKREFNEGLFECAKREIKEETRLEIKNIKILCHGNGYMESIDMELHWHFLEAEVAGGELNPELGNGELEWLTLDEMLARPNILGELKYILPIILQPNPPMISYKVVYDTDNQLKTIDIENN